jgi:lipopolysaccharide transport system permease protein
MAYLKNLVEHRDLLWLWTFREVRVRYQQSLLGVGWAILQPLSLTLVFSFVFSHLVRIDTGGIPYPVFAFSALVPWTFFTTALSFGIPSLVANMNLVTKVYFPREILPLADIGAAAVDFLFGFFIFLGMMILYRLPISPAIGWLLPIVGVQLLLTAGVTLIGAAVTVFFRDVRFIVPLLLQIWMYATPVIYPIELIPPRFVPYYYVNPMVGIIDGYRRVLLQGESPLPEAFLTSAIVAIVVFILGYSAFKHAEPMFGDLI